MSDRVGFLVIQMSAGRHLRVTRQMPQLIDDNLDALRRRFGRVPALADAPRPTAATTEGRASQEWIAAALPSPVPDLLCGIALSGDAVASVLASRAPSPALVLFEPDPGAARRLLERRSWVDAIDSGRLAILVGPDYAGAAEIARRISGLSSAPVLVDPRIAGDAAIVTAAKAALARLAFSSSANDEARRTLGARYVLHTLSNLPRIAREGDAGHLTGRFAGVPAIIAAAGPSLDRNLQDLGPILDRALVIGCDTAAWPLVSANAAPHLVVAVDASEANARHLSSLPAGEQMFLAAEGSVHPSALGAFAHRTFFLKVAPHEPWPWLGSIGLDRARVDAWGSVATSAFAIALDMGCDPIVFIGADFAFTGGRPYCRGTSLETIWSCWVGGGVTYDQIWAFLVDKWPAQTAVDVHGHETRTSGHLVAFRDWVAERAASRTDRTIINATDGGILHGPGIRQARAFTALASCPAIDAAEIRRRLRAAHAPVPDAPGVVLAHASALIAGADEPTIDRWRAFASPALSREAIVAALSSPEQRAWLIGATAATELARTAS